MVSPGFGEQKSRLESWLNAGLRGYVCVENQAAVSKEVLLLPAGDAQGNNCRRAV
jgi:hypothetical protein